MDWDFRWQVKNESSVTENVTWKTKDRLYIYRDWRRTSG